MEPKDWVPVAAIVMTAMVTAASWFVSNALGRSQKLSDRRAEAYVDYLTAMSRVSNFPRNSKEWLDADIAMLEARHRILLYGKPAVIDALQGLYEGPRFIVEGDGIERYTLLLQTMQYDLTNYRSSREQISRILIWGHATEPSSTSQEPQDSIVSGIDVNRMP